MGWQGDVKLQQGSFQSHHGFAIKLGRTGKKRPQVLCDTSGEMRPGGTQQLLEMLRRVTIRSCAVVFPIAGCWLRRDGAGRAGLLSALMKLSGMQQSEYTCFPKVG